MGDWSVSESLQSILGQSHLSYATLDAMLQKHGNRMGVKPQDHSDLFHEALLRVGHAQPPGAVTTTTYLFEAYEGVVKDAYRRSHAKKRAGAVSLDTLSEKIGDFPEFADSFGGSNPSSHAESKDLLRYLDGHIQELGPDIYTVFQAVFIQGLGHVQAAKNLGMTSTMVDKRVKKIRDSVENIEKRDAA